MCAFFLCEVLQAQNNELLGSYKIGYIGKDLDSAKNKAIYSGIKAATKNLGNEFSIEVETIVFGQTHSQTNLPQTEAITNSFLKNVDGIIISPSQEESLLPLLQLTQDYGKEIIFLESKLKSIKPLIFIKADEFSAGSKLATAILKKLPTSGRIAILTANKNCSLLDERMRGVKSTLGYKRIETTVYTHEDYPSAIGAVKEAQEADSDRCIKGWIFLDDWALRGIPDLPWEIGKMPLVTFQSSAITNHFYDMGYIKSMVIHPYYQWGYQAAKIMIEKIHQNAPPLEKTIELAPILINRNNYKSYKEKWKSWLR